MVHRIEVSSKIPDARAEVRKRHLQISGFPVDNVEIVDVYAQLKTDLEKAGERLDEFDLLIGASAKVNRFTLVTGNVKHFARIPGIKIYEI